MTALLQVKYLDNVNFSLLGASINRINRFGFFFVGLTISSEMRYTEHSKCSVETED